MAVIKVEDIEQFDYLIPKVGAVTNYLTEITSIVPAAGGQPTMFDLTPAAGEPLGFHDIDYVNQNFRGIEGK